MKKSLKIIFIVLLVLLVSMSVLWLVMFGVRHNNKKRIASKIELLKEKISYSQSDTFSGCFYDEFAIISLNHQDYFIIKDNQVRVYDAINSKTKEKYPNLPIDSKFEDFYWVLENCR